MKINVVDHSIVKKELTILRNKETNSEKFRISLKRISLILASEATKNLALNKFEIQTPLEKTNGFELQQKIVLVPILRAGLSLVEGFLALLPHAQVGHIGLQRNEETLQPIDYYFKVPSNIHESKVLLLDPMLATGGSASGAIKYLKNKGAKNISLVSIIAAPEGISKVNNDHPEVEIFTASVDRQLNDKGYILPGLGDAGDRTFGTE